MCPSIGQVVFSPMAILQLPQTADTKKGEATAVAGSFHLLLTTATTGPHLCAPSAAAF